MNEYRRDVQKHKPDSEYARVELGPAPELPAWHIQSKPTSYQFPTNAAALKFAAAYRGGERKVTVHMKEGAEDA